MNNSSNFGYPFLKGSCTVFWPDTNVVSYDEFIILIKNSSSDWWAFSFPKDVKSGETCEPVNHLNDFLFFFVPPTSNEASFHFTWFYFFFGDWKSIRRERISPQIFNRSLKIHLNNLFIEKWKIKRNWAEENPPENSYILIDCILIQNKWVSRKKCG